MRVLFSALGFAASIAPAHAVPIYGASNHDPVPVETSAQPMHGPVAADRDRSTAERPTLRMPSRERERSGAGDRSFRGMQAGTVQHEGAAAPGLFVPFSASRLFAPLDKYVAGAFVTVPGTSTVLAAITRLRPLLPDIGLLASRPLDLLDEALDQPLAGQPLPPFDTKPVGVAYSR